jgi:hypothetical protein
VTRRNWHFRPRPINKVSVSSVHETSTKLPLTVQFPHCHARQGKDCEGICDMGSIHGARLKAAWDWIRKLQGSWYGESV